MTARTLVTGMMNGFACCMVLGTLTQALHADCVEVAPIKDNTLVESLTGATSNGMGDSIFSGRVGSFGGGARLRAVLAFDLSAIPAGSTIHTAALTLTMTQTVSGDQVHTLHRLLTNWGEGASTSTGGMGAPSQPDDATWIHTFYPDQFWQNAGGDFNASASATQTVGLPGAYTWSGAGLVADVQQWVNSPGANYGWIIRGNEAEQFSAKKFASRQAKLVEQRPLLTITFTPPPSPCPADVAPAPHGDGVVNVNDLLAVINSWGPCPTGCQPCPGNAVPDGIVNVNDLLAVINGWGVCP